MNTAIHVFVGPSLPTSVRATLAGFVLHGPAAKGDVYNLVAERPLAIAVIDGYFERVPTVWHKEILWALAQGVHVFGAASMGALRAAELSAFGMVGVGQVFEDLASGRLTDDDEVTIVHADAAWGYRAASEAMVNIRATLSSAERCAILSSDQVSALIARTKRQFYPDRCYPTLLLSAREELQASDWQRFAEWLRDPTHRVDQKQLDAMELLKVLNELRASGAAPKRVPWTFQHTDAWEQVRRTFARPERASSLGRPNLDPRALEALTVRARLRALEIQTAQRDGFRPSQQDIAWVTAEYCRARSLSSDEALRAHLLDEQLAVRDFEQLMRDQACVRRSRLVLDYDLEQQISDVLRLESGLASAEVASDVESSTVVSRGPEVLRLGLGA